MQDSFFQYGNLFKQITSKLQGLQREFVLTTVHPKMLELEHQLGSLRTQTKVEVLSCIAQLEKEQVQLDSECQAAMLAGIEKAIKKAGEEGVVDASKLDKVEDVVREAVKEMISKETENGNKDNVEVMKQREDALCIIVQDGLSARKKVDEHFMNELKTKCKNIMTQHKVVVRQYVFQFYSTLEEINRVTVAATAATSNSLAALQSLKFANEAAAAAGVATTVTSPWWLLAQQQQHQPVFHPAGGINY